MFAWGAGSDFRCWATIIVACRVDWDWWLDSWASQAMSTNMLVGHAGIQFAGWTQFSGGGCMRSFCTPDWSRATTLSMMSRVSCIGSWWRRGQVGSPQQPQKVRWQQVSIGTLAVHMRVVRFWLAACRTCMRGVLGSMCRTDCCNLYSESGRHTMCVPPGCPCLRCL